MDFSRQGSPDGRAEYREFCDQDAGAGRGSDQSFGRKPAENDYCKMCDGSGEVYIFDEPTKGVDVGAKEEIYRHILNLAKADKFVILISSDMPELLSMSDRIGVMCGGRLVDIVDVDQTTESDLMRKYLGLS